jgi:hypothetical protein
VSPVAKLVGFAVVLGAALGGGAAAGNVVGPLDTDDADDMAAHSDNDEATRSSPAASASDELPGGVLVSQAGYTLAAERTMLDGAAGEPFRFRITDSGGEAVQEFEVAHERELHLIVVGRDLATFAHLHPSQASDGTWSVDLPALAPGAYRAFADFSVADGPELTLGVDLTVPGSSRPAPLPPTRDTTTVDDYEVALAGTPVAGTDAEVELTVSRDGEPVSDLEPYLGAAGHLVAIRNGDLAYLHVHPMDGAGERNGPGVRFAVEVPSPGTYRLFFDFAHRGEVRTAAFTVHVPPTGGGQAGGEHADDGKRLAVDAHGLADDLRVRVEALAPQPIAEDDDLILSRLAFGLGEIPAELEVVPDHR